jgi:hypothetical protein
LSMIDWGWRERKQKYKYPWEEQNQLLITVKHMNRNPVKQGEGQTDRQKDIKWIWYLSTDITFVYSYSVMWRCHTASVSKVGFH